jgi:2',3'-cyclic-nucleotide 2'-phosphodiesterase (5'-nucleotidase family)
VGLLGLISNRHPLGGPPEEKGKYYLADPIETAKKIVPRLRKKCDLIVALAHLEPDDQRRLAQSAPDIFFILSGHNPAVQPNPTKAHNSSIFEAGSRGEHLGQVDFYTEGKDLFARYEINNLTLKYADHPQALGLLNQYKAGLRKLLALPPTPEAGAAAPRKEE